MLTTIGLALIAIGWLLQLIFKDKREINPWFLVCYGFGVALLVIDTYSTISWDWILNFVALLLAWFVLMKMAFARKAGIAKPVKKKGRR